jgi:hypothetical protein
MTVLKLDGSEATDLVNTKSYNIRNKYNKHITTYGARLQAGRPRNSGSSPSREMQDIFSSPKCPGRLWDASSLLFKWYKGLFV